MSVTRRTFFQIGAAAVTRAADIPEKLVVLVGTQKALRLAVQRHDTARRCTALALRFR